MLSTMMAHPHGPPMPTNGGVFGRAESVSLPLNLLVTIIGYVSTVAVRLPPRAGQTDANLMPQLDDPADLARACRTCRVLHYMCLPKLYASVVLHSYDHIRFSEQTMAPEGMGGASPFVMGLNALITGNVAQYTRRFELKGEMQEYGLEENAQAGRVPDGGMMLGLLVRTIIDRMPILQTFKYAQFADATFPQLISLAGPSKPRCFRLCGKD